ncbi:MAG: type II secretion system protein GspF, partial [Halioglobus sp.]
MTAYRYQALNASGKLIKGVVEGDSERQVRSQLRGQSLRPVEVGLANRQVASSASGKSSLFAPRISMGDFALVTRQLATLVTSNLPLDECLQA